MRRRRTFVSNGNGVSRGDRNRNARLARLRDLVPTSNAIVGIDLADDKQMVVVTDHDSRVLARRTLRCKTWAMGAALDWARPHAEKAGFAGVTVACEPTGHRWRVLGQLAGDRAMPFVCVQPVITSWSRRTEDLTFDKTDEKDAVLIARATAQLRCYVPEAIDETWGRLRHLGARRDQLIVETVAQVQQMRDLLECVWPAALQTARQPFKSRTWAAALSVVLERDGGDLDRTRRLGVARFETAVRREIGPWGGQKPCLRIARYLFTTLSDPAGVIAHRRRAFERIALVLADWHHTRERLTDIQTRMLTVLDELELTELATSIHGLSALGAAAILAQTGDLTRFASARAVVKHAGLAPREKISGSYTGGRTAGERPRPPTSGWRSGPHWRRCRPSAGRWSSSATRPTSSTAPRRLVEVSTRARLGEQPEQAGREPGPVGAAHRADPRSPRRRVPLGQGPPPGTR
jgi:transposase